MVGMAEALRVFLTICGLLTVGRGRPALEEPANSTLLGSQAQQWVENCGFSKYANAGESRLTSTPHILGGVTARQGEFPWQVALYEDEYFRCGGVLIDSRRVLTAAHCVTEADVAVYDVTLAEHDRANPIPNRLVMRIPRENIIIHEEFEESSHTNDIAMLILPSPVIVNADIRPVCAPPPTSGDYYGRGCTVSGWGAKEWLGDAENILHFVNVTVFTRQRCDELYPLSTDEGHLCAGDPAGGRDACTFDSGGPLVYKEDGKFELVGLVSFGQGCGDSNYPGVYTNIQHFRQWIDQHGPN